MIYTKLDISSEEVAEEAINSIIEEETTKKFASFKSLVQNVLFDTEVSASVYVYTTMVFEGPPK